MQQSKPKRTLSAAHKAALLEGKAHSQGMGRTSREIGREKARMALEWVYQWGWSSPALLDLVVGTSRGSIAARLVKQGFLKRERTPAGGVLADTPVYALTLTRQGVAEVQDLMSSATQLLPYSQRINFAQLRHDYFVQRLTLRAIQSGLTHRTKPERILRIENAGAVEKIPDAEWHTRDGQRVLVEVELSGKWRRDFDEFVRKCLNTMHEDPQAVTHVYSVSKAILARYKAAFEEGREVTTWKKVNGRWTPSGSFKVPAWALPRMTFTLIDDALSVSP